ncbi:carboxymuconolactone decarboxylase family protein [Streptomyces mangrovisoli]|uniref:Carboxymuconolactone decarboxylase n=1 Tax=Streptomyces mangrovisoli TaxID=1428628 RepID=A0A1J4NTT2_9ACTN|nr:carboxymuconolactone decarboxylase family protein [Streptomyces mangrovisoli]OIJ64956.1 carboxymuconolactone decarboxylase [Streptomyces mangrovisoli]
MEARLRRPAPEELDDGQRAVYEAITSGPRSSGPQAFPLTDERGRLRGPFNAMLLSPTVGLALQGLGGAVRYGSALGDRAREMAILAVAAHWHSTFERDAHEAVGRAVGLTEPEMAALRAGVSPDLADTEEAAAVRATHLLLRHGSLSEQEYGAAVAALGERGLFDVTTLVGYYATLALQLRVFAGEARGAADG